jgi:excinuclease ABC subunit A
VLGLDAKMLAARCSACGGRGSRRSIWGSSRTSTCRARPAAGRVPRRGLGRAPATGVALPDAFGKTIDEIAALLGDYLDDEPGLARKLQAIQEVGLGYLVLRQPGYALSGGEAQRLKIAEELCRPTRSETLYILDEPTVGQHLEDVARLIGVLHRLVEAGNTVLWWNTIRCCCRPATGSWSLAPAAVLMVVVSWPRARRRRWRREHADGAVL